MDIEEQRGHTYVLKMVGEKRNRKETQKDTVQSSVWIHIGDGGLGGEQLIRVIGAAGQVVADNQVDVVDWAFLAH